MCLARGPFLLQVTSNSYRTSLFSFPSRTFILSSLSFVPLSFLNLLRALSPCRNFPHRDIHSWTWSVSAFSLTFIWNWNEIETSIRSQSDLGHTSLISSSSLIRSFYRVMWYKILPTVIHYLNELLLNERNKAKDRSCGFPFVINISTKFLLSCIWRWLSCI